MAATPTHDPLPHLPALSAWTAGRCLDLRVRLAATFTSRLRGLLGVQLPPDMGLHIRPCASVHMWGMRRPLDVVFLDREGVILRVSELQPWQVGGVARSASVLECAAGTIGRLGLRTGQRLQFQRLARPAQPARELRA